MKLIIGLLLFSSHLSLQAQPIVAVVHASAKWDHQRRAKLANDWIVNWAQKSGIKRVFLTDGQDPQWYVEDDQAEIFDTDDGGHTLRVRESDLVLTGGYAYNCLQLALIDFLRNREFEPNEPFSIHLPMDAIYAPNFKLNNGAPILMSDKYIELQVASMLSYEQRLKISHSYDQYEPDFTSWALWGWSYSQDSLFAHHRLSLKEYTFEILFDGERTRKFGTGEKSVHLSFWTTSAKMALNL